ncbi:hypothetical protein LTR56_002908 [Elasticomyces elasticus]|nr:hypothetical protein LTR56_002908 [Elasticomyces elasticus]KAK3665133.1 hypothetical protein LTR22_003939 [Elasticomyces elasticus]KAK4930694.1 hypothetical protein LTR49_002782 [Elasticomyces elasticus]KAK5759917.1 hypothetical protein LTS12_009965 [Elasticomyces elasticus]
MAPTHAHTPPSPCDPSDGGVMTPDVLQEDLHPTDEASTKSTVPERPKAPSSTPTLMTLPAELLLQILTLVIPSEITAPSNFIYRYYPSSDPNPFDSIFRAYHATTLVSHHYHNLSRSAFFDQYTHELGLSYSSSPPCACEEGCGGGQREFLEMASLSRRWCQRKDVRRMKVRVYAYWLENLEIAVGDLVKRLERFSAGVREVEMFVETVEHSSRVLGLAENLWVEVGKWKAGVEAARSEGGMKMRLAFECHDQRILWDEKGDKQVKVLRGHLLEDGWDTEELATAY